VGWATAALRWMIQTKGTGGPKERVLAAVLHYKPILVAATVRVTQ